jgi:1,2-phenylacetyl-CoA epoxidase catalytic subunit
MNETSTAPAKTDSQRWLGIMVASLADNKAALGRRYAEWAVSAPTLESAVGAAAMAQDELGHARSTYPVMKSLGLEPDESGFGGDRRFAVLDDEFPDWATFVAANLVIDGTLATFVRACDSSSVTQLCQRAKKILQEEGSHRVHAEAWTKRICAEGGPERERLLEQVAQCWTEASYWLGPVDESGSSEAVAQHLVRLDPDAQRQLMRDWLVELFAGAGIELELDSPQDWSNWDPERRRLA